MNYLLPEYQTRPHKNIKYFENNQKSQIKSNKNSSVPILQILDQMQI